MAVDTTGPKNEPIFNSTGAPEIDVDPTAVAAYAAKVGNRRVGTTAERLAATGKDVWEGLEWDDTDEQIVYRRTSGGWSIVFQDWTAWTPTLTNFSLGNGTITAKHQQAGKRVHFFIELSLGSTSSASGAVGFSTPVAPASSFVKHVGVAVFFDTSTANTYLGQARIAGGSTINVALTSTSLSVATVVLLSNTVPSAPANGDTLYVEGSYERA